VPGANVHDLLTKKLSVDASDPTDLVLRRAGGTQLEQGLILHPTFVTLWIGNNDALGAATNGNPDLLTPAAQFEADYRTIANAIAASGAKMAIATIPDVTSIPFVTTLTRFIINPQTGTPVLLGGNPVPLIGVNAGDFVLLSATRAEALGFGIPVALGGNGQPLPGNVVLTPGEVATIQARVQAYNAVIRAVASEKGAALVDANATLTDLATNGINIGGVTFTARFLSGGVFSYDGVHPTPFGYAVIANMFIDAINDKFGGHIPEVDLFPFVFKSATTLAGAETPPFYFSPLAWENLRTIFRDTPPQQTRKPPRRRGHH
jgi:lysophospholipase L1-like esterase